MENKIDISKLLKDCPRGMELDCTMYEDVCFDYVDELNIIHCYIQHEAHKTSITFNQHGTPNSDIKSKCVIFPKGKTTWEGFHRPFEDGDVVVAEDAESFYLFLLKHLTHSEDDNNYDGYCYFGWDFQCNELFPKGNWVFNRLANEEEKAKLFDAIKANGYKWNEKTKTLEKLVEPKFKVGDKVLWNYDTKIIRTISKVQLTKSRGYVYWIDCEGCSSGWWNENELTPIPNKFDINTLKPFESKVLMRSSNAREWVGTIFSHYNNKFYGCGMCCDQCIPYEGNEHLLGKTDDCDEYFKNW